MCAVQRRPHPSGGFDAQHVLAAVQTGGGGFGAASISESQKKMCYSVVSRLCVMPTRTSKAPGSLVWKVVCWFGQGFCKRLAASWHLINSPAGAQMQRSMPLMVQAHSAVMAGHEKPIRNIMRS
eukprot:1148275-Pelagomonas_calceolata.AAC.2